MASPVIRLLALIALVSMPLGMSETTAHAAQIDHGMTMSGSGHCQEKSDQEKAPASKKMDCAAACTALPATGPAAAPTAGLKPADPSTIASVTIFSGIVLEIATPPPKLG